MEEDQVQQLFDLISNLRVNTVGGNPSPHKYIFLLSLIKIYESDGLTENRFTLDSNFESIFKKTWLELFPESHPNKIFIEYPFYHLVSDGIWDLKISPEKQKKFDGYLKIKKKFTKQRLQETVDYGFLDSGFHSAFSDKEQRTKIASKLYDLLKIQKYVISKTHGHDAVEESISLFAHEAAAIKQITNSVKSRGLGYICSNIDIHDPQSNRYFEIDMLIVSPFGLYVVELKHWTGSIEVQTYSWWVNGISRSDPHKVNNHKAKLIKGFCEREFRYLDLPFVESVVALTHPESVTKGCSNPRTNKNLPTFDGIDKLVDYLKHQQKKLAALITPKEAEKICDYIRTLHKPGNAKGIQFPGYEIVERLYQAEDRAEFIARPTYKGNRSLTRLRIFFNAGYGSGRGGDKIQIEKARATLNVIANIKDHPNILRVMALPSQEGHLIEVSDWSAQGTLQDLIARESPLEMDRTVSIMTGILKGLSITHSEFVVHRNLCPENILMVEDIPKLMNFDISYQLEDDRLTVIPDPDMLKRTAHVAPEVYNGADLSESADLFSAGVLFYQMLTGELPFKWSLDLIKTQGRLPQSCVDTLKNKKITQEIVDLIEQLLQLDTTDRPESAKDVLNILAPFSSVKGYGMNTRLSLGDNHDQFEILEFIKQGAESQIYKARSPIGQVFLKLFNIDVPQKRIISEKQMSAAVSHGSIVKAEFCQLWKDQRYLLAFKWIDGTPITSSKVKVLPEPELFSEVSATLLNALEKLHGYEEENDSIPVLHNDIKPENILLNRDMRPMLIDFGIACHPSTGLYSGTPGYVPPDSISGEDRNYSEKGDLFGLGVTLFEWFFGKHPYDCLTMDAVPADMQSLRPGTEPRLEAWFLKAVSVDAENRFESAAQMLKELQHAIGIDQEERQIDGTGTASNGSNRAVSQDDKEPEGVDSSAMQKIDPNPFVAYLNTLHNRDAANGNALAENQACNKWFGHIHVGHPLTELIFQELVAHHRHVILTGHAGDGKSTIGLELYKRLKQIPVHEKLKRELGIREDIETEGTRISIIKDFSEWDDGARMDLIKEAGKKDALAMLLISNTGTLLAAFKHQDQAQARDTLEMENELLKAFSSSSPTPIDHNGVSYLVINLAMFDNLEIARKVFERMIDKERWEECDTCDERDRCTVCRNVTILHENPLAVDRIFYLYRRMFEYKDRFTLRQLIGHMAYMITAGKEYADIQEYANAPKPPRMTEFMFFNRFFGDSGRQTDKPAGQMQVIRTLVSRELGLRPCPSWERLLWLREGQTDFQICAKGVFSDFDLMRRIGAGTKDSVFYSDDNGRRSARQQVRRMLFFLHDFVGNEQEGDTYIANFLNSSMLLPLLKWRKNGGNFSSSERQNLKNQVIHVLQEQFAGVRLPEREAGRKQLYITLNRNNREIRQGTQVVLADFPAKEFQVAWDDDQDEKLLVFSGTGPYESACLILELPFLDYVQMRQHGEAGQPLQTSFSDRLEYFKAQLIRLKGNAQRENEIVLLRLQANHSFKEHRVIVEDNKLEVMNA